jgi:cellulose synthase/poly-beta-1,6-N-acetylglucosamine synthase-like glycosyltransferase
MRAALEILFWLTAGLIVWTQLGYAAALAVLARLLGGALSPPARSGTPSVSLIVAAHDEQASIGAKVANALTLDYPRELLEVVVACDGCTDATSERARAAGADLVLELPRGGKVRAQDAAVERSRGEIVAFSDANAQWEAGALRALVGAFAEGRDVGASEMGATEAGATEVGASEVGASEMGASEVEASEVEASRGRGREARRRVGYACGQVRFFQDSHSSRYPRISHGSSPPATNQEGVYWRYELAVRALESRLCSITAGNGAIYATRREAYIVVDAIMGHDLSFPFNMVKRGWRAVYVPGARAEERMVPSIEGELARKRRMMSHTWPIVLRGGMLSPRGYPPGYALMILSHRVLRYATPFLHALALAANVALVAVGAGGSGPQALYVVTLAAQLVLLAAAGLGGVVRIRVLLIARYYVLTTASLALGLWDWLRHGTNAGWEAAEGTRPPEPQGAVG